VLRGYALAKARVVFTSIDARLIDLAVPTEEWDDPSA
jgi:hypothetical protein